jgi:alpha-L-arabinofuranosidase
MTLAEIIRITPAPFAVYVHTGAEMQGSWDWIHVPENDYINADTVRKLSAWVSQPNTVQKIQYNNVYRCIEIKALVAHV